MSDPSGEGVRHLGHEGASGSSGPPRGDSPQQLLAVARDLALEAGGPLLESFREGSAAEIDSKSTPTDLVSDADRLAERTIRRGLAARRPRDGFLGEESGGEEGQSGLRWVVDPLDGTVNYLFGIPQWCVSIAAQDAGGTIAGVVYDPVRGDLFSAVRGEPPTVELVPAPEARPEDSGAPLEDAGARSEGSGALLEGSGVLLEDAGARSEGSGARSADPASRPADCGGAIGGGLGRPGQTVTLAASACAEPARAMVATGFAYDAEVRAAQAAVLARVIPRVRDIRRFGSAALDLAWTAAGCYDAYYERTVKPWDIAAGRLLCEAAGLRVVELPAHESLPWGILVAPPGLCEAMLELVGGVV